MSHIPVLLNEVIEYLDPKPGEFIIDGTINGGGHTREILRRISPGGTLLGVDWDSELIAQTKSEFKGEKVVLAAGNYADLPEILRQNWLPRADGLLLDLGFSSSQLQTGRGFSFQKDEPLQMTYDPEAEPAWRLVNELREPELISVIRELGGERFAGRIARAIKVAKPRTTKELRGAIVSAVPRGYERGRIDPATRTFQAIRIFVNRELDNLKMVIAELSQILNPGGRAVILTFHSLEDAIVKNGFRNMAKEGACELLTKKPISPTREEILQNPRSRSAKLRAIKLSTKKKI
ncbi:MAG TPA: 16S rRNA (cytosine(1402)-N(4))-methyltransferase RsmH [Candidatus Paceibacterota bacterium]